MQFEQVTKDERVALPRPSIDTGLGLERMACILQGVDSVFETDLFRHLIDATASALGHGPEEQTVASFRVIADHLRSSAFLVADGVLPSNEGRGYVLRRIMRRAMRHAQLLGAREPLMHRLVWALVREMGQAYPDLVRAEKLIEETLRLEETRFRKTLERGLSILDEKSAGLKKGDMFDGDTAFTLYDTYGFPLDLTQDALKSRGISVDQASFTDAMERQREKARASWSGSGDTASENIWFPLREKLGATEFLGYDTESAEGVVTALVKDGKDADSLKAGESGAIVLNQTPFYAESGGQVGDTGLLTRRGRQVPRHRHAEEGRRSLRACGHGGAGHAEGRHARCSSKSTTSGAHRSGRITRRRICCMRRCGRCSAITSPSAARWWRRIGCGSISCIRNRSRRKNSPASRTSPTRWCSKTTRSRRG